jgi:protein-L-isoaspartate(D-aspartate) O-methyltransferase
MRKAAMENPDWGQVSIMFADQRAAEKTATGHLQPALAQAQADGAIDRWFYVRKSPFWRLRYAPSGPAARRRMEHELSGLAAVGRNVSGTAGIYEPEAVAFGGDAAMSTAHDLFCADSRHILDYLALSRPGRPRLGQREMGILLPSMLMRAAGQDWYEQGDIWARVSRHRTDDGQDLSAAKVPALRAAVRRLMTVDTGPSSLLTADGPLTPVAAWTAAFDHAGQRLADQAALGTLQRGLRAVLAHHVIFHWNRLGLTYGDQRLLAHLAADVVMAEEEIPDRPDDRSTPL